MQAATRGDGTEGENVTANVMTIKQIPHRLKGKGVPELIEVRGEIYLRARRFRALNAEQAAAGEQGVRQSEQRRRRLAAPARSLDHRAPAACASSPTPGARPATLPADTQSGVYEASSAGACRSIR